MCVISGNCLFIHDHNRTDNVYSYDPKDGYRSAKTVNATVGYQDAEQSEVSLNDKPSNMHLWPSQPSHFPIQCHLNGVQISEVLKFLAATLSETTHAIELVNPFNAAHPLIIPLQLSGVTSYFDVYSPNVAEYEKNDIPNIHLTGEEHPWDPSTNEYSERETHMLDHQGQTCIPATVARGPVYISTVVSYSLASDAADVMDNDNLATALLAQIQISIVLIGTVRKPSVEPIVLAKRWGITPENAQKTIQATT